MGRYSTYLLISFVNRHCGVVSAPDSLTIVNHLLNLQMSDVKRGDLAWLAWHNTLFPCMKIHICYLLFSLGVDAPGVDQPKLDVSGEGGDLSTVGGVTVQTRTIHITQDGSEPKELDLSGLSGPLDLSANLDLSDLSKDFQIQSRTVKTVVTKKHIVIKDGEEVPEEVSTVTRTEVTKQEGDDAPEKDITLVKKELIDGEEKVTMEHSTGDQPLDITAMPIMMSQPGFELVERKVERKVVRKRKLIKTIVHPDGREETVVEEKEDVLDDTTGEGEDTPMVMDISAGFSTSGMVEFEPETKPEKEEEKEEKKEEEKEEEKKEEEETKQEPEAEQVSSLVITEDSDFRLPGGPVEVVGDEVAPSSEEVPSQEEPTPSEEQTPSQPQQEVEHGHSAPVDLQDEDTAQEQQEQAAENSDSACGGDSKEESPEPEPNTDSTDLNTSDLNGQPEPMEASGVTADQPSRGGGGKGKGRRKKNRKR